jgi:hypothetical protein
VPGRLEGSHTVNSQQSGVYGCSGKARSTDAIDCLKT